MNTRTSSFGKCNIEQIKHAWSLVAKRVNVLKTVSVLFFNLINIDESEFIKIYNNNNNNKSTTNSVNVQNGHHRCKYNFGAFFLFHKQHF